MLIKRFRHNFSSFFSSQQSLLLTAKIYLEPCQISKIERSAKIAITAFQPLTIFVKHFILDVWKGSEYAFGKWLNLKDAVIYDIPEYCAIAT